MSGVVMIGTCTVCKKRDVPLEKARVLFKKGIFTYEETVYHCKECTPNYDNIIGPNRKLVTPIVVEDEEEHEESNVGGSVLVGTCSVCKRRGVFLNRKRFTYPIDCDCCNGDHVEIVDHCDQCTPIPPSMLTILLKSTDVKNSKTKIVKSKE